MAKNKVLSIEELASQLKMRPVQYLRTGVLPFDMVFKGKGIPSDTYGVLWGSSGFGKTTLCMSLVKSLSQRSKKTMYAMVEPSMQLAEDMGLTDDSNALFLNVRTYDEAETAFDTFLSSDFDLMILDSATALSTQKVIEMDEQTGEMQPASDARLSAALLKKFSNMLKNTGKFMLVIGQERANFNKGWVGPDTTMAGGYALKFYSGYVIHGLGEAAVLSPETKEPIGTQGYLTCPEKNRMAPPKGRTPIQILYGKGQSNVHALFCYMQWKGYYSQGGASFKITFGGKEETVKGRTAFLSWIKDHYDVLVEDLYKNSEAYFEAGRQGWKPTV